MSSNKLTDKQAKIAQEIAHLEAKETLFKNDLQNLNNFKEQYENQIKEMNVKKSNGEYDNDGSFIRFFKKFANFNLLPYKIILYTFFIIILFIWIQTISDTWTAFFITLFIVSVLFIFATIYSTKYIVLTRDGFT